VVAGPTIEGFLTPRSVRHRQGTAEGWYNHSTDLSALHRVLLDPLGPGGDRRFQHAAYDQGTDTTLCPPVATAPADAVLVFDGVFLPRPELMDRWELLIFVSAPFETTIDRARVRDQTPFRSAAEAERRYRSRYIPSQLFYFDKVRPADHADIIVYNDEPSSGPGGPGHASGRTSAYRRTAAACARPTPACARAAPVPRTWP
jgi:uridine kinase